MGRAQFSVVAGLALATILAGCLGGDEPDEPSADRAKAESGCGPEQPPVSVETILTDGRGWAFGQPPAYVSFLDIPMYRAAERGEGSFVPIDPERERNGRYAVKMMTILHPAFAGTVQQEIAAVTEDRTAAFGAGSSSSAAVEELSTTRVLEVGRADELVPGQLVFSGPGCYRLTLEADGRRYEVGFPVEFLRG